MILGQQKYFAQHFDGAGIAVDKGQEEFVGAGHGLDSQGAPVGLAGQPVAQMDQVAALTPSITA